MTRKRKLGIALLGVALLLVAVRLSLPYFVKNYVNRQLMALEAYDNLEFDNGPHSMTRVVLRYRLLEDAKKGDSLKKRGAVMTLKFMKEQGSLMALRDEPGETGQLAAKAFFELMNPKITAPENLPAAKEPSAGVNVMPGK